MRSPILTTTTILTTPVPITTIPALARENVPQVVINNGGNFTTLYHGTTSNRASKIVGNQFDETQGFKNSPTFLAEDLNTAEYFAGEKLAAPVPNLPKSASVIEFKVSEELASKLGIGAQNRSVIGGFADLRFPDIAGGTGYERVLLDTKAFNEALKSGLIDASRIRVK